MIASPLFPRQQIRLVEFQPEPLQPHWLVVVEELLADAEEIGAGGDVSDLMEELAGASNSD
jgi:hypothetical protein